MLFMFFVVGVVFLGGFVFVLICSSPPPPTLKKRRHRDLPSYLPRFTKRVVIIGYVSEHLYPCFVCSKYLALAGVQIIPVLLRTISDNIQEIYLFKAYCCCFNMAGRDAGIFNFYFFFPKSWFLGRFCLS